MATMINGHMLTHAETRALDEVQDWLRLFGSDSGSSPNTSPLGDGRWTPITEIFPQRNARANSRRQTVRRLHRKGILAACEIAFYGGCVKAVPFARVGDAERAAERQSLAESARLAAEARASRKEDH